MHINSPEYGKCIAAKVLSEYNFDEGLKVAYKTKEDFKYYFEIDVNTIIEFDRNDPNILPSVNLKPRYRYQRVHNTDDFLTSIDNLKNNTVHD